jgi:hypothetical protein
MGRFVYADFKDKPFEIYEQRTKRYKDLIQNKFSHKIRFEDYDFIYSFAVVPDIFDIESIAYKIINKSIVDTQSNLKSFAYWKKRYQPDFVDVVFVSYSKIDEIILNPVSFLKNSGYTL